MQHIPPADEDTWFNAEGKIGGRLSLLRIRPELRSFSGQALFPRCLKVSWNYGDNEKSGMPSGDTDDLMKELEDKLVRELESKGLGLLAFVVTERGTRTWSFYISESGALKDAINGALSSMPRLPIQLRVESDPGWSSFSSYAAALGDA